MDTNHVQITSQVFNHVPQFLGIFAQVLAPEGQLKEHTQRELVELIRALNSQFTNLNIGVSELGSYLG